MNGFNVEWWIKSKTFEIRTKVENKIRFQICFFFFPYLPESLYESAQTHKIRFFIPFVKNIVSLMIAMISGFN